MQCWGYNGSGQLGQQGFEQSPRPVVDVLNVPGEALSVAAGHTHVCALLRDGRVACWRANDGGQPGDGTRELRTSPVIVQGL